MEYWWKNTERGKPKFFEKNLYQFRFVLHQYHAEWTRVESQPPLREAGGKPPKSRQGRTCFSSRVQL